MLKPKKMSKVLIVGGKEALEKTITTLYDLKIIHIIDYNGEDDGFSIGRPIKKTSLFSEYILSLRALKDILNLSDAPVDHELNDFEFSKDFKSQLNGLEENVIKKHKKLDDIHILLTDIEKIDDIDEIKKLGLSKQDFDIIWNTPNKKTFDYPSNYNLIFSMVKHFIPIIRRVFDYTPLSISEWEIIGRTKKD